RDSAVSIGVERRADRRRYRAERDLHRGHELVDRDRAVATAIARASGRGKGAHQRIDDRSAEAAREVVAEARGKARDVVEIVVARTDAAKDGDSAAAVLPRTERVQLGVDGAEAVGTR